MQQKKKENQGKLMDGKGKQDWKIIHTRTPRADRLTFTSLTNELELLVRCTSRESFGLPMVPAPMVTPTEAPPATPLALPLGLFGTGK